MPFQPFHSNSVVLALWLFLQAALDSRAADPATWPGQYKIRPWETSRLTAADIVGPDGIVYPDFTQVGVTGGIPNIDPASPPAGYTVHDVTAPGYGASGRDAAHDDTAVASALTAALATAAAGGKSILYFPAGTYFLSQPLTINQNHVIIAGAGMTTTTLKITTGSSSSAALFAFTAEQGGTDHVPFDPNTQLLAAGDLKRGDHIAAFTSDPAAAGYSVGQWVRVIPTLPTATGDETTTMRSRYSKPDNFVNYDSAWDHFPRVFIARITAVNSATKTVTFDRCFPHDYFADEAPGMRRGGMLEGCGLQDLQIETESASVTLNTLSFLQVAESWVGNVHIKKPRNWSYSIDTLVRSTFQGCHFDGTWATINNGSSAYLPPGNMDCLMDSCQANGLRHMPIFQQNMRCVVRNSTFSGESVQSPQCHGRFPVENLIETSDFDYSTPRGKSIWASDFTNTRRHGPNGPRQIFYNNRIGSGAAYVQFGGALENPIIVYNRVLKNDDTERLPSFWATDHTFDAIIRGNVFQTIVTSPFIILEDPTCTGWEVTDNHIYGGNRAVWAGDSDLSLEHNNRFHPASETPLTPAPEAASLYQWQKDHAAQPRLVIVIDRKAISEGTTTTARITRVKADTSAALTVSLAVNQSGLSVPASVSIPAGQVAADVTLTGNSISGGERTVTLTASASGLLTDTEKLFVLDAEVTQPDFGLGKFQTIPVGLPAGWHAATYGEATAQGTQSFNSATGTWTIQGAGIRTVSTHGTLARSGRHFVYKTMRGDAEIIARLTSTSGDSDVGIMIADDEAQITDFIWVKPTGAVISSGNNADRHGAPSGYNSAGPKTVPIWLRLKRVGSVFTASTATATIPAEDDWTQQASVNFHSTAEADYLSRATLDGVMHYGMFINSDSLTTLASATFTNVTHTGTVDVPPPADTTPRTKSGAPSLPSLQVPPWSAGHEAWPQ